MTSTTRTTFRHVPPEMFRFAVGSGAELYTAVLHAFGEANERLETALTLDDVHERLRSVGWLGELDDGDLSNALASLREWKLLDTVQNHSDSYRTAREYERRNLQYSLSRRGEAAYAGVQHALDVLDSTGALQTAVLDAIADKLGLLDRLLSASAPEERSVYAAVMELETHLEALRNNTKAFNGELQRLLRSEGVDITAFHEVKAATVAYLQEFLSNLDQRADAVAAGVRRVEERGVAALHQHALVGADLPELGGADPAPEWLAQRARRWEGLRAWFLPADATPARVEQLHEVARRAIITLLQVLDRLTESRRRSSSTQEDFRALARWFAAAPTEEDAHTLWSAAFGLGPSRHVHLTHPDPELLRPSARWADSPPVPVSALLRQAGRTEKFARAGRVRDTRALAQARRSRARQEEAEVRLAWERLATDGPVRLSEIVELEHVQLERLLDLIGRALEYRPDSTGARRATTADGRVELVMRPTRDGRQAVLRTARGSLTGPDQVVSIDAIGTRQAAQETRSA